MVYCKPHFVYLRFSWAKPGGVLAILIGIAYIPFLRSLDRKTAIQFVVGGALFVGGAVGVELATESYADNDELNTLAYYMWTGVEEGMEMAGVLVFLQALIQWMRDQSESGEVEVSLGA